MDAELLSLFFLFNTAVKHVRSGKRINHAHQYFSFNLAILKFMNFRQLFSGKKTGPQAVDENELTRLSKMQYKVLFFSFF